MIQIVCGEDSASARAHVSQLQKYYTEKSYLVHEIEPKEIFDIQKEGEYSAGLFQEKQVFIVRNLSQYLSRSRKWSSTVKELSLHKDIYVIDWEDGKSTYELGLKDKKIIKEFKLSSTVFTFLDSCIPGNTTQYISHLHTVLQTQEDMFLYLMLCRHIRSLILARYNSFAERIAPWQKMKLTALAKKWDEKSLLRFYRGLIKIDQTTKTGTSPYTIRQALEMLGAYYL